MLLHGRGAAEADLVPMLDALDPGRRLVGLTPGAPLPGPGGGRWWYHVPRIGYPDPATFHATLRRLGGFLDGWLAERAIGWDRTVLGGFSQGAVMSYAAGLGPGRPSPAGVLAISGFIPTVEGWDLDLGGRDVPLLVAHGSRDPVISVDFARAARTRLHDAGLAVEYLEHGGAHQIDPRAIAPMQAWIRERLPDAAD